jgi:hypothetical protein
MTTLQTQIPDQLIQQAQYLVQQGPVGAKLQFDDT